MGWVYFTAQWCLRCGSRYQTKKSPLFEIERAHRKVRINLCAAIST
jgi:hypothetical protein